MSLINQMLKDLEQRGANTADAEMNIAANLNAVNTTHANLLKSRLPLLQIGGIIILIAASAHLWTQNILAQSRSDEIASVANVNPQTTAQVISANINNPASAHPTANADTSRPLFETELKFKPEATQAAVQKTQKNDILANLPPPGATGKPVEQAEIIGLAAPEKLPVLAHVDKASNKANIDNTPVGKQIRPDQQSGNFYRQALVYLQQGRVAEAQANLTLALEANASNHEARQTLAGLLLDNKRNDEARTILAAGLAIAPEQIDFRMALARLQVEAGDITGGLNTLEQGLSFAKNDADYQNFLATLLQRANRHEEAINHYTNALSLNSTSPSSLIGLGISLQAVGKLEQSQEAFMHAQSTARLSPELSIFVEQRIKQINQRLQN